MHISKQQALGLYAGSQTDLAKALGIKPQAVQQWAEDQPIPQLRAYQLRDLWPHVFGVKPVKRKAAA